MRTASANAFFDRLREFRELLRTAKRGRVSLASHRSYAPKASESIAALRKTFLMMQQDYPETRYPRVAFQVTVLRPLLDNVVAAFPTGLKEMLALVEELSLKAGSDLAAVLDAPEDATPRPEAVPFLPDDLLERRQGVFQKVLWEANRCYDGACYNACAIMLRRLVEGLIVEAFDRHGMGNRIQDGNGDYLDFGALIGKATNEAALKLTRNTKRVLPNVKFCGDLGAHNRMALVRKADLDRLHDDIRAAIEELSRAIAAAGGSM